MKKSKHSKKNKRPVNRTYKDRLFKAIFGQETKQSKLWRLSLYNTLNNSNYTNPDDITVTTIENVIYITMKNDVSFLIGSQMNLYEQQSSFNPNMPLRGLLYFAQLYQMNIEKRDEDLFGTKTVKIPSPKFIVFYNGDKDLPDEYEQHLSDAFDGEKPQGFEWTAHVINISGEHNLGLQKKCKPLYDYCVYVNTVKGNLKIGMPLQEAVGKALNYAIQNNLLDGYFKMQKMEVLNMSLTEFDQEAYDRHRRREGFNEGKESGILIGIEQNKQETARNALALGLPVSQISKITGLSIEDIQALAEAPHEMADA